MAKLDHTPLDRPPPRAPAPAALSPTPSSSSSSRRIGLASGVDRTKVRSIHLGPSKTKLALGSKPQPAASAVDPLATLARAARAILARPPLPTPESLQALYSLTEHVVHKGNDPAQQLYDRLRLELERAAGDLRRSLAAPVPDSAASTTTASSALGVKAAAHEAWIKLFDDEVGRFGDQVLLVRSVFLHLDRTYVLQSPTLLSIWSVVFLPPSRRLAAPVLTSSSSCRDLGLSLFQDSVLSDSTISSRITSATLDLVGLERSGTSVQHAALRSFFRRVRSFATPAAYDALVLAPFLDATAAHYAAQGDAQAVELDSVTYLARVVEAFWDEDERVKSVFGGAGEAELLSEVGRRVEDGLITGHVEDIATKGASRRSRPRHLFGRSQTETDVVLRTVRRRHGKAVRAGPQGRARDTIRSPQARRQARRPARRVSRLPQGASRPSPRAWLPSPRSPLLLAVTRSDSSPHTNSS